VANLTAPERTLRGDLRPEIETLGGELRRPLRAVLEAVAGDPPRPTRIARAVGLDKSLASRCVRAVMADSDLELMHIVPSPEGLRILADLAADQAGPELIQEFLSATQRFAQLIDRVPGGRATIDAQISEESTLVRERSEHAARQAAFKSMSFLLGHYCETLSTSLFLVPSPNGRMIDGIEVHRRLGLRRMRPGTPLALLSMHYAPEDEHPSDDIILESIDGAPGTQKPDDYLLREFSSDPLPDLEVMRDGKISTLVLAGDPSVHAPTHISSAFRVRNGWTLAPDAHIQDIRGYVLHVPARRLVRDLYVAEPLYPGAFPRISYLLPGPRGNTPVPEDDGARHYASVNLQAPIEALPGGSNSFALSGSANHSAAVRSVLERAGHATTRFRGWRSTITYPVPMLEMIWWLVHPNLAGRPKS
jgi:hypothetical protein